MDKSNLEPIDAPPVQSTFETRRIGIEGMTCDKCVEKIEKALKAQKGVNSVHVDRERKMAVVTFDASKVHLPDLHDALLASGYKPTAFAE
jgi:copper ion binding protein